jgi:endonuclease/exonuclease/phosphatase family metal-dependent hydrolase
MDYTEYPTAVAEDIVRLRRRFQRYNIPPRRTDYNLLVGTWNIRNFGGVNLSWEENGRSPVRNLRALAYIAETIRQFDVVAVQEVKRDTHGIRMLLDDFLGSDWGVLMSDVSGGSGGNSERLAYLYDRRRVLPSGLAGEIVLPPTREGNPTQQFVRTPYIVGFESGAVNFSLLTAHIKYGDKPRDRIEELTLLAGELRDRARSAPAEETNLIVLGDFNIDRRAADDPLFQAFASTGLFVPEPLRELKTTYGSEPKHYDQIAWFMGDFDLSMESAGVLDFTKAIYKELTLRKVSDRVSDHFPLWVEFNLDQKNAAVLARTLKLNPDMPDPFSSVPD